MRNLTVNVRSATRRGYAIHFASAALVMMPVIMTTTAHAADAFATTGAKAAISVEFIYESAGKKHSEGLYDPHEWRVKRTLNISADLAAQAASPSPIIQALDAAQTAELAGKVDKAQGIARNMAPTMASVEKIMAKCGEDEACISREAQKMGAAMQGNGQMDTLMSAKKDFQQLAPGAARYQAWIATAQTGNYLIDEATNVSIPDPLCYQRPRKRCTRVEIRKGAGEVPLPPGFNKKSKGAEGIGAVEVDSAKNTITVRLPTPLYPLPYTETITTDEPEGSTDTPTPKGPQQKQHVFRTHAGGTMSPGKPFTVPLKGGWRSQSGEYSLNLPGEFGNSGKLKVLWRFKVQ